MLNFKIQSETLAQAGYVGGTVFKTNAQLLRTVRAAQRDHALGVDEDFGKLTLAALKADRRPLPCLLPDIGLSEALEVLFSEELVGYVSNTMSDAERLALDDEFGFVLGLLNEKDRAVALKAGNKRTKWGLTCGHAATYLLVLWLCDPDNRYAATGMNLEGARKVMAAKWKGKLKRASNCAVALLDGDQIVENWEEDKNGKPVLKKYKSRGYADKFDHLPGCAMKDVFVGVDPKVHPFIIVEQGKHVICCIWLEGCLDPRDHQPIIPAWYRIGADYGVAVKDAFRKPGVGVPWTFRRWWDGKNGQAMGEPGVCIHRWLSKAGFKPRSETHLQPRLEEPK
jgi:hypothetical protein